MKKATSSPRSSINAKAIGFLKELLATGILPENLESVSGKIHCFSPITALAAHLFNHMHSSGGYHGPANALYYTPLYLGVDLPDCESQSLSRYFSQSAAESLDKETRGIGRFLSGKLFDPGLKQPASQNRTCSVFYTSSRQTSIACSMIEHMKHFDYKTEKYHELWNKHSVPFNVFNLILDNILLYILGLQPANTVPISQLYIPIHIDTCGEQLSNPEHQRFVIRIYRLGNTRGQTKFGIDYIFDENHKIPTEGTVIILADVVWWRKPSPSEY